MKFWVGDKTVKVNIPDWDSLESTLNQRIGTGQGFVLATLNLDHLAKMRGDEAMQFAYNNQDLVVADGNPIVWMAALANRPVTLMPGSDLITPLAQYCANNQLPVALVGSTPETLNRAAKQLQNEIPELNIVKTISPAFGFDPAGDMSEDIHKELASAGVKMCFVALGAPKQEVFATFGREFAPNIGYVCIGAGLDFIAGSQKRAPLLIRKLALEWLWRMGSNPGRLAARYLSCIAILPGHVMRSLQRDQNDQPE